MGSSYLQTVQSQQRAERDAALARLEQSRIILAMRLADHQGKRCKVIEEALAFVGDVRDANRFVSPENLFDMPRDRAGETLEEQKGKKLSILMRMLVSSLSLAKDSLKMEKIGGVLGNAALFAVSMLAFLQLHQVALRAPRIGDQQRIEQRDGSSQARHFDVFSARG